jgi:hypothetical protein
MAGRIKKFDWGSVDRRSAVFLAVVVSSAVAAWGSGTGAQRPGFGGGDVFGDGGDDAATPSIRSLASISVTPSRSYGSPA